MSPMHDDRDLVEERITRELHERVLPLVHPDRRPLTVEAGPSLDELSPFEVGERWGAPWATTWFRFTRRGAGGVVGPPGRGAARPRLPARRPRLPVRGARPRRQGPSGAGRPPAPPGRARDDRAGPGRADRRGGVQPDVPAVPALAAGVAGHGRRRAAVPSRPRRAGARRPRGRGAGPRPRRARRGDADAGRSTTRGGRACGWRSSVPSTSSPARPSTSVSPRPAPRSPPPSPCRPGPAPTASSPPATLTSTRRGCGRSPRRCASAAARSPRRWR